MRLIFCFHGKLLSWQNVMKLAKFKYFTREFLESLMPPVGGSLCLFATYDRSNCNEFRKEVTEYIKTLAQGFDAVWVLTNHRSQPIHHEEVFGKDTNVRVICMTNMCIDFGMWFRILRYLLEVDVKLFPSRIALVNDSTILVNRDKLLHVLEETREDFWGMTDSMEKGTHHLQSYFLVFDGSEAIRLLHTFVVKSKIHNCLQLNKRGIIERFEIGLSSFMGLNKITLTAMYPFTTLMKYPSPWDTVGQNPSYVLWDRLLYAGMPLLKKRRLTYPNEEEFIEQYVKF